MKNTTRITLMMGLLMVVGMVISLCGGVAAGIVLDRTVLNKPGSFAYVPTHVPTRLPTRTPAPTQPRDTATPLPPGSPTLEATPTDEPTAEPLPPTSTDINLDLIAEAWDMIQQHFVDRPSIDGLKLTYGAISGMVNALGDTGHSRFLSPEALKKEHDTTSGNTSFEGIGVSVESRNGVIVIVSPIDGTPAQKAGLLPGDMILKVDGKDVTGAAVEDLVSLVRGPAGTSVTLTIFSPSTNLQREVTLIRAKITQVNVTWQALPGTTIAHLRISQFSTNTAADVKKALQEIKDQKMTAVILDLRNNPGGLVNEVVGTTSQFLSGGTVFIERDAAGKEKKIPVARGGIATGIPLVVLVNKGSASASEILSGALQDASRAKLVGETTFGTGTVLTEFPLSDGSVMLLAIQEWLTPNGRVIWHTGIVPDFELKLDLNVRELSPEQERSMSAADIAASKDTQLLKAMDLLKTP